MNKNKFKVGEFVIIKDNLQEPYSVINIPEDGSELYTLRLLSDWNKRTKLEIVHEDKLMKFQIKFEYSK